MRLTVIPSDNIIIKDGQRLVFEFAAPADLHAIQWYGTHGFIETTDGKQARIDSLTNVQAYIDLYAAEAARLVAITPTLPELKAAKIAALNAERRRIETLPISGNQSGKLFTISRPEKLQEFLMGGLSIALDSNPAATFTMLDDNGVSVEYSKVLMGQIIKFINSSKAAPLARYAERKAAIEAAKDQTELDAVITDLTKP